MDCLFINGVLIDIMIIEFDNDIVLDEVVLFDFGFFVSDEND